MRSIATWTVLGALSLATSVTAQSFQRLGTCPKLGCIFPPDQADFLQGQLFDIRLEIHAPVNGSEAYNSGNPDTNFTFCVSKNGGDCQGVEQFFGAKEATLERWNFTWFEDYFARDAKTPSLVNVAAKAYRALHFEEAGEYQAYLKYYNGMETVANWNVRPAATAKKAKNAILFIGDGMATSMITAARLLGHKTINGKYQSLLQLDKMEALGHQMTHSIDTFITDSANSATAIMSGHKSTVNALNVYVDSSKDYFDDPKFESFAELFTRYRDGQVGIVSTAYIADATPAAMCAHTRARSQYADIVAEYLYGSEKLHSKYEWPTSCKQPAVIFGGGAEQFYPGPGSYNKSDFYQAFRNEGYQTVFNKTSLTNLDTSKKTLGIFSVENMAKWLDREVYPENLKDLKNSPSGDNSSATDQPGLKDMTLKAIDILHAQDEGKGWVMMSEAASIDKMMHVLDYDRALGELLELDDTVKATMEHLKKLGIDNDTLIVVTADHSHGFDVYGSADTKYLKQQPDSRSKRSAIGVYEQSGLSGYQVAGELPTNQTVVFGPQGEGFPVRWDPRYAAAMGFAAMPDHRDTFSVNTTAGEGRLPATPAVFNTTNNYVANPNDQPDGILVNGTLPISAAQGVHSLADVSIFATGPGAELFRGVMSNIDIFYHITEALALGGPIQKS